MKLGEVLKKERERRGVSAEETAVRLNISSEQYDVIEAGDSLAEQWGPVLQAIAITLEVPTSRLLTASGKFADTRAGQAGERIAIYRNQRGKSIESMAETLNIPIDDYRQIETGQSPIETVGPILLGFAEIIEQPISNLFYPCGLPFQELDDYP